jgi:mycothiol synthase
VKGLETAPLTPGDAADVTRVWEACEIHDDGESLITEEDLVAAFKRPSMDLERHGVGVRDGDALVAAGLLYGEREAFVHVAPSHRGRGIGAWLLRWSQDAARRAGHTHVCQTLSENEHAARALLEANGFERGHEGWIFEIELDREPDAPVLPAGYSIRDSRPGEDDGDVFRVIDEAFGEWQEHEVGTLEDWTAETLGRPGFRPELLALALHGDEIVGAALLIEEETELWVSQLAVARPHRGRGLGRALLAHAFGVAWRRGRRHFELGTDSRTGARGLYEHVGMRAKRTSWEYCKSL